MANIVSIIFGIVAAVLMIPGLIPLLGWLNWLMIPFAVIGLLFGLVSRSNAGRNLNLVVLGIGIVRLMLGGGII